MIEFSKSHKYGITLMELDRLVRARTLGNLGDSINTLGSLSVLIQDIEGMTVEVMLQLLLISNS